VGEGRGALEPLLDRGGGQVRALAVGAPGEAGPDDAVDAAGEVRRRYGARSLLLIRPDGHLAARGRPAITEYPDRPWAPAPPVERRA